MKKIILLFVIIILFCACNNNHNTNDIKINAYANDVDTLYFVEIYGYATGKDLFDEKYSWYIYNKYKTRLQAESMRDSLINKWNKIKKKEYKPL